MTHRKNLRLVWQEKTHADFQNIIEYYSEAANQHVAYALIQRIVDSAEQLLNFPYIGHVCTDDEEILEWHIPNTDYSIPYRVKRQEIQILRVFHQSQGLPDDWE